MVYYFKYYKAKTLHELSAITESREQSKYEPKLRFCNSITLAELRRMWKLYSSKHQEGDLKDLFTAVLQQSFRSRKRRWTVVLVSPFTTGSMGPSVTWLNMRERIELVIPRGAEAKVACSVYSLAVAKTELYETALLNLDDVYTNHYASS
ncbi:hypothetical protein M434DRAFT_32886 [Hypoxylon sp. CO27-5]|nr:hypothetical protein M434DRAFT_32886 [Hypoxylon sp. CO27-5]